MTAANKEAAHFFPVSPALCRAFSFVIVRAGPMLRLSFALVKPTSSDRQFASARQRTMLEWRRLPEVPDPARRQHVVSALVPKVFEKLGLAQRFREEEIVASWAGLAGEFAARYSHPLKLKNRVLVVAVSQPAVLWTLDRSRATLLGRLQEKFGAQAIRDVRFQAG